MTKADLVQEVSGNTGIDQTEVLAVIENTMSTIKKNMTNGHNIYLRGFGSFICKKRAEKLGRNISKGTTVMIPAHYIPAFKPSKSFVAEVKENVRP